MAAHVRTSVTVDELPLEASLTAPLSCSRDKNKCRECGHMGQPAARVGDKVLQETPHCHAPIHPAALVPTPVPHPGLPLAIIPPGGVTVLIGGQPAARLGDMTQPCMLPGCTPAGPGVILKASATVTICGQPAARVGDMTEHASCVAPIPSPTGVIMPPGCPTVLIGG